MDRAQIADRASVRAARLIFMLVSMAACGGPTQAVVTQEDRAHVGEDWYVFRAQDLGIDLEATRERDAKIPEDEPPELDAVAAREGAVLWRELCARCHGLDGQGAPGTTYDPEPKTWGGFGVRMGFFFGGDKMRAGIYRSIREGGEPVDGRPSVMPPWKSVLSREQTWALVHYIEGF